MGGWLARAARSAVSRSGVTWGWGRERGCWLLDSRRIARLRLGGCSSLDGGGAGWAAGWMGGCCARLSLAAERGWLSLRRVGHLLGGSLAERLAAEQMGGAWRACALSLSRRSQRASAAEAAGSGTQRAGCWLLSLLGRWEGAESPGRRRALLGEPLALAGC